MYIIQFSRRLFKNPIEKKKKEKKKSLINAQNIYTVYRHCEINRGL